MPSIAVAKKPSLATSFKNSELSIWLFIMCHLMILNLIFIIK
ncbi:hypothetical protein L292_2794 [Acinetobacter junii CIP 107470 = MTCC 11364]|uniref:Uncharacterized protein n=1 Tax=Acinetobacter junii CIP 107470 = MTCC 11364 TaxID=1217666 RepID=S7Y4U4_ACIJU|nr:hypothetical protein F953_01601 [Acinetobacter junii CIP 107470 = MTCC 11364]EPR86194.1 hypothetical protein L292_2794 [Acinetobacter junii CIP 107470 = MTCC 11364]